MPTDSDAASMRTRVYGFDELADADLTIDALYMGGSANNAGDDPIGKLLPVGNQGGFRYRGSPAAGTVRLVVLYTSGTESDWPDRLDPTTGDFTYYGDNRRPGHELHDTRRKGNLLLQEIFRRSHGSAEERASVPPILLFSKAGTGRDVVFRGLLAPGSPRLSSEEELVAVWRTTLERRFQNYRAHFTVLACPTVSRGWIDEVLAGVPGGPACPPAWRRWVQGRIYEALEAPRTVRVRSRDEQLPRLSGQWDILRHIHAYFTPRPHDFEHFAVDCWVQSDHHVGPVDVTRPSRDGGRDAVGTYLLGPATDPISISFALEAKCYDPDRNSVGVREVARLVSRLKHRDFGVFVTTAHVNAQAYREVREDEHPVIFITGRDIVDILTARGFRTVEQVSAHLRETYPQVVGTSVPASAPTASRHADFVPLAPAEIQLDLGLVAEQPPPERRTSR